MRVYISSHDRDAAESLAATLTAAGHEVVSTWHRPAEPPKPDLSDWKAWHRKAETNFREIEKSDVLVLIGGTDRYPGGKYVEAGYALGARKKVYNLGETGNGMMHAAGYARDPSALLAVLR